MYDLLDILEDSFSLGFGKSPLGIKFSTPYTKDINPAAPWKKEENNYKTVVRMIGVNPEDVKVELENYGLHVSGETEEEEGKYSQDIKLGIAKDVISNIQEITYSVKNGVCRITLIMKQPEESKVEVKRV